MTDEIRNAFDHVISMWTERPELFDETWPYAAFFFAMAFIIKRKPTKSRKTA